jgi:hypothetical protein
VFTLLKKLFGQQAPALPAATAEADENLSDKQILKEYFSPSKEARQALKRLTALITRHLGSEESKRLANRVMACLQPGEAVEEALVNGLVEDDGPHGNPVVLSVDWRAADEVAWQANALLQAFGVTAPWELAVAEPATVPRALLALSAWAGQHGLSLLHIGGDGYAAFLVRNADLPAVLDLAAQAGLTLHDEAAFARENLA